MILIEQSVDLSIHRDVAQSDAKVSLISSVDGWNTGGWGLDRHVDVEFQSQRSVGNVGIVWTIIDLAGADLECKTKIANFGGRSRVDAQFMNGLQIADAERVQSEKVQGIRHSIAIVIGLKDDRSRDNVEITTGSRSSIWQLDSGNIFQGRHWNIPIQVGVDDSVDRSRTSFHGNATDDVVYNTLDKVPNLGIVEVDVLVRV